MHGRARQMATRKSTDEGLDQDFNSLDAQRESAEAFIRSQQHEGWVCVGDRYDDGGFTGSTMDRPALKRLLADIEAGKIDCVVVYKVDRLSRSLLDFARIMEAFDKHQVSFVSVTQAFNTATSMGRLVLNVLLSFAQFEREMIAERTRDKIAGMRRKGKWCGGRPILGYDVALDTGGPRLVVNQAEAEQVREIFALYLQHRSLLAVAQELQRRGWHTKSWTTRKGTACGGFAFDKNRLHGLLTNVTYTGKLTYKDEIHDGRHEAIVTPEVFKQVQAILRNNGNNGGSDVRGGYRALLKGLLFCGPCGCAMSHTYTQRGKTRYRYYVCMQAQKRGWNNCPSKSLPAAEIERFVVDHIRGVGRDPRVVAQTVAEARKQIESAIAELETQGKRLTQEIAVCDQKLRRLSGDIDRRTGHVRKPDALADAQSRILEAQQRAREVRAEVLRLKGQLVDESEVKAGLAAFDPVWQSLSPGEQARLLHLLIEKVVYHGAENAVSVTFRPTGIKHLAEGTNRSQEDAA